MRPFETCFPPYTRTDDWAGERETKTITHLCIIFFICTRYYTVHIYLVYYKFYMKYAHGCLILLKPSCFLFPSFSLTLLTKLYASFCFLKPVAFYFFIFLHIISTCMECVKLTEHFFGEKIIKLI